jgi:uncharacterized tellurite resistance protein B-like protein
LNTDTEAQANPDSSADLIRCTATELGAMPATDARFFNALSFVLTRVANADQHITPEESGRMERVLVDCAGLTPAQSVLVVEIAKHRALLADTAAAYTESRNLRQQLEPEQRQRLLECLFAVADADGNVSCTETLEIRQLATELGFSSDEVKLAGRSSEA